MTPNILRSPLDLSVYDLDGAENTNFTFSIASGNEGGYFSINKVSGGIFLERELDFETSPTSFTLVVDVDDDNMFNSSLTVSVSVLDENDNRPSPSMPNFTATVSEELPTGTQVLVVNFTDPDTGTGGEITYQLDPSETDFVINSTTGVIFTNRVFNYEAGDVQFIFTVFAMDGGSMQGNASVTVVVMDENDNRPVLVAELVTGASFLEESPEGIRVANVSVTDEDVNFSVLFATVTITDAQDMEVLSSDALASLDVSSVYVNNILVIAGALSPADYASVLSSVEYINMADEFSLPLSRNIQYLVCDQLPAGYSNLSASAQAALGLNNSASIESALSEADASVLIGGCPLPTLDDVTLPLVEVNDRPVILTNVNTSFQSIMEDISVEANVGQTVLEVFGDAISDTDRTGFKGIAVVGGGPGTLAEAQYSFENSQGCVLTINFPDVSVTLCHHSDGSLDALGSQPSGFLRGLVVYPDGTELNVTEAISSGEVVSGEFPFTNVIASGISNLVVVTMDGSTEMYEGVTEITYVSFGSTSDEQAVVLGPFSLVRFDVFLNRFGTESIQVRAWDGTDGIQPSTSNVDTTALTTVSVDKTQAEIYIEPVNDVPVLDLDATDGDGNLNFTTEYEEGAIPVMVASANVLILDPDHLIIRQLEVNISKEDGSCDLPDFTGDSLDVLHAVNFSSLINDSMFDVSMDTSVVRTGQACQTYTYSGSHSLNTWEMFISMLRFSVSDDEPSEHVRRLQFVLTDDLHQSDPVYTTVAVSLLSDNCPVVTPSQMIVQYVEHSGPVILDDMIVVTDADRNSLVYGAEVTVPASCPSCSLNADCSGTGGDCYYDSDNATLIVDGPFTPEELQSVLRTMTFVDEGNEPPGSFIILQITVLDNDENLMCGDTNVASIVVMYEHINDNPAVIFLDSPTVNFSTTFTEGAPGAPVTGSVAIVDADSDSQVNSSDYLVVIEINDCLSEDSLFFMSPGGDTVSSAFSYPDCLLQLNGTISSLQSDLELLRYGNSQVDDPTPRSGLTITFTIIDSDLPNMIAVTTLDVVAVNDAPAVDLDVSTDISLAFVTFIRGGAPVAITGPDGGTIIDVDGSQLTGITAVLQEIDGSGNILSQRSDEGFETLLPPTYSENGITGSFSASSGQLVFSGAASIENYITVLNQIQYSNERLPPSDNMRRVTVTVVDESGTTSVAVFTTITINGTFTAPILDLGFDPNNPIVFVRTENPVKIAPSAALVDPDGDNICLVQLDITGTAGTCNSSLSVETSFQDIEVSIANSGLTYVITTVFEDCRSAYIFQDVIRSITFSVPDDAAIGVCTISAFARDFRNADSNVSETTVTVEKFNEGPCVDLDLGLFGRDYSTVHYLGGPIVHVVSILDEERKMFLTNTTIFGEADGEAAIDGVTGGSVINEMSYAGYKLTDDDETLEYLELDIFASPTREHDAVRYPCMEAGSSEITNCGYSSGSQQLVCDDSVFDGCSSPDDLCTDLSVTISCNEVGSKIYRFVYSSSGNSSVVRYEALLGYLGYQFTNLNGNAYNHIRLIDVRANDGEKVNPQAIARIKVSADTLEIQPPYSFNVYEDERVETTCNLYHIQVVLSDGIPVDPSELVYTILSGNTNESFRIDTSGEIVLHNMLDRETIPSYDLEVNVVVKGGDPTSGDTMVITATVLDVNDNHPVISDGLQEYSVNVTEGEAGVLVFDLDGTDRDIGLNAELVYLVLGIGSELFKVDGEGILRTAVALNASVQNYYFLVTIATDRGTPALSTHAVINVNVVTPLATNISIVLSDFEVNENALLNTVVVIAVGFEIGGTDENIEFRILSIVPGEIPPPFAIDTVGGEITVNSGLDAETTSSYQLTLEAYSTRTLFKPFPGTAVITATILDINEFSPELTGPLSEDLIENAPDGTVVLTLTAEDQDAQNGGFVFSLAEPDPGAVPFTVHSDGRVVVADSAELDYETVDNFTFTVRVSDVPADGSTPLTDEDEVVITLLDANDHKPEFPVDEYHYNVSETAPYGFIIFTVTTMDADTEENSVVFYTSPDIGLTPFCLNGSDVIVCLPDNLTSLEEAVEFSFEIVAVNPSDDAVLNSSVPVRIQNQLRNEFAPVFDNDNVTVDSIVEEHCRGSCDGLSIYNFSASDSDGGVNGVVSYAIENVGVPFVINSTTGEVTVSGRLDREQVPVYTLTITASDVPDSLGTSFTTDATLVVRLLDINDNPPDFNPPFTYMVNESRTEDTTPFATLNVTDVDEVSTLKFNFFVDGEEPPLLLNGCTDPQQPRRFPLVIDSTTGSLSFCESVNHETDPTEYNVVVFVEDSGLYRFPGMQFQTYDVSHTITVIITDENEHPPVLENDTFNFAHPENSDNPNVGLITATDEDSGLNALLVYSISYNGSSTCSKDLPFQINSTDGTLVTCMQLDYEEKTSYSFQVLVRDSGNPALSANGSVNVEVIDRNDRPPIFSPPVYFANVSELMPANVEIVELVTSDEDSEANSQVSYFILTHNDTFGLLDNNKVVITDTDMIDFDHGTRLYILEILAINYPADPSDVTQTGFSNVTIQITDTNDLTPVIHGQPISFSISENVDPPALVGCINASDADTGLGGRLDYSILGADSCSDDIPFVINETTGCISSCQILDYESSSSYVFVVEVCDSALPLMCSNASVTVEVIDLNDNSPQFLSDPITVGINENSENDTFVVSIESTDDDSPPNSEVTYTLGNNAFFYITNSNEVYYRGPALDYESDVKSFIILVNATNPPAVSSDETNVVSTLMVINVIDQNDEPPVFDPEIDSVSVLEHSAVGTPVYNLTTTDADTEVNSMVEYEIIDGDFLSAFTIVNHNMVVVDNSAVLDRDEPTSLLFVNLTISATNEPPQSVDDDTQEANFTLIIRVDDINDNYPFFTSPLSIILPENATRNIPLYDIQANDIDAGMNGALGLQFALDNVSTDGNPDPPCSLEYPFLIDEHTGELSVCVELDHEKINFYEFVLIVCDSGSPKLCTPGNFTVSVMDINDNPPVIHEPTVFSVLENATMRSEIGCINASDADSGANSVLTYSLNGMPCSTNVPYQIDNTTGCLLVCRELDYETIPSYEFEVVACDYGDPVLCTTANVTVSVTNINDEPPVITTPDILYVEEEEAMAVVTTLTAVDNDAEPFNVVTFSLIDDAGGRFVVDPVSGELNTTVALDRENRSSYVIVIGASDSVFFVNKSVIVMLLDINDNPPVYRGNLSYSFFEESPIELILDFTDADDPLSNNSVISFSVLDSRFNVSDSGVLRSTESLDRDPGTGGSPEVNVTVVAMDEGSPSNTVTQRVTLVLVDINDNSPIVGEPQIASIVDGTSMGTVVLEPNAEDHDEGLNGLLSFTPAKPSSIFAINETTGAISLIHDITLAGESSVIFVFEVMVSDSGLEPRVTPVNFTFIVISSVPMFTESIYNFTVEENKLNSFIGNIMAMDRDGNSTNDMFEFTILHVAPYNSGFKFINQNETGLLYSPDDYLDYEDASSFELEIGVGRSSMLVDDTAIVNLIVTDINDNRPHLSPLNITVNITEHIPNGTVIATAVGIDFDTGLNGLLSYNHFGEDEEAFRFDDEGNFLVELSDVIDYEELTEFIFSYQACDGGEPQLCSEEGTLRINVLNIDDLPPVFDPSEYQEMIFEDHGTETVVLNVLFSDDDTPKEDITLSLEPPQSLFQIVQITGAILTTNISLDRETSHIHQFNVIATDHGSGINGTATVTILVSDVNDVRPYIDPLFSSVSFEEKGTPVLVANALTIVDDDELFRFPLSKVEISLHPSPTSLESYPLNGGVCDHANYSLFDDNAYKLCGVDSCQNLLDEIFPSVELNNKVLELDPNSIARVGGAVMPGQVENFTLSLWLLVPSGEVGNIVALVSGADNLFGLAVSSSGSLSVTVSPTAAEVVHILSSPSLGIFDGQWHQIAMQASGEWLSLFFDGELVARDNITSSLDRTFTSTTASFFLSATLGGSFSELYFCDSDMLPDFIRCTLSCGEFLSVSPVAANVSINVDNRRRFLEIEYLGSDPNNSIMALQSALEGVSYVSLLDEPHPLSRGIFITVFDLIGPSVEPAVVTVEMDLINDKRPVLDLNGPEIGIDFATVYEEMAPGVQIVSDDALLFDEDSGYWTFQRIVVGLKAPILDTENLTFVSQLVPSCANIVLTSEPMTFEVQSSVPSEERSPECFVDALKAFRYQDNQEEPPSGAQGRQIEFTVYDSGGMNTNSPISIATVTLIPSNDAPTVDLDTTSASADVAVTFLEKDGEVNLLSGTNQAITDPDSSIISMIVLVITKHPDGEEESLQLSSTGSISAIYNATTRSFTISGSFTFDEALVLLRSMMYVNTYQDLDELAEREVSVVVQDDGGALSEPVFITISVELFNNPPEVYLDSFGVRDFTTVFLEDRGCISIVGENATIIEPDSRGLQSVQISLRDTESTTRESLMFNGTTSYAAVNQLSLIFLVIPDSSPENYVTELKSIYYCNTIEEPKSNVIRSVVVSATDLGITPSQGPSLASARSESAETSIEIMNINDRPILDIEPVNNISVRGVETPVINPIDLIDPDDNLFYVLLIFITNNQDGKENEIIGFDGDLGERGVSIGPFVNDDGEIFYNVTFADGFTHDEILETVGEIRYNNQAQNITVNPPRIICLEVMDSVQFSYRACVEVEISPPNDFKPRFLNESTSYAFSETSTPVVFGTFVAVDEDKDLAGMFTYSIYKVLSQSFGSTDLETNTITGFSIDPVSGVLEAPNGLDAEEYIYHIITLVATDMGNPQRSDNITIEVTVSDVNDEPPVFSEQVYIATENTREGSSANVPIATVSATDRDISTANKFTNNYFLSDDRFSIFSSGVIRTNQVFDIETQKEYVINVSAVDNGSPPLTGYATVIYTLEDINDNPAVVNQVAKAVYVLTDDRSPSSIGPSIRISDNDESGDSSIKSVQVSLPGEENALYGDCLSVCQDVRLANAGLADDAINLFSLATFVGNNVVDTTIDGGDCAAVNLTRAGTLDDTTDDTYGRISRDLLPSDFGSGGFTVSVVGTVRREGYIFVSPDSDDDNDDPAVVDREFALWIRRRDVRFYYTTGLGSTTERVISYKLSESKDGFDLFFDTDLYVTRHYTLVVTTDNIAQFYVNCRLLFEMPLQGQPNPPTYDVFIGQSTPNPTKSGRLEGEFHGLYYIPRPLSSIEIGKYCSCSLLCIPEVIPSSISITEPVSSVSPLCVTSFTFEQSGTAIIPVTDVELFLRNTTYETVRTLANGNESELSFFVSEEGPSSGGNSKGFIYFVDEDNYKPRLYLEQNSFTYSTTFKEDTDPANLVSDSVRLVRTSEDIPVLGTFGFIEVLLENPLDGNEEYLTAESSEVIEVTVENNATKVTLVGPGIGSEFTEVLGTLTYFNTHNRPTIDVERSISFIVHDTEGRINDPISYTHVTVLPTDDKPEFSLDDMGSTIGIVAYNEGNPGVLVTPNATIQDQDSETLSSATVILTSPNNDSDTLAFNISDSFNISGTYASGVITFAGIAPLTDYQAVFRTLTFESTDNPLLDEEGAPEVDPTRILHVTINDGGVDSEVSEVQIEFITKDDPPVLTIPLDTIQFFDGDPPKLIAESADITDIDNRRLTSMTLTLSNDLDNDVLSYNTTSSRLLSFGVNLIEDIVDILRDIVYVNSAEEPSLVDRFVEVEVCDGIVCISEVITIQVIDRNDNPPMYEGSEFSYALAEDISVVTPLVPALAVTDNDADTTFNSTIIGPASLPFQLVESDQGSEIEIQVLPELDFEVTSKYVFNVTTSDGDFSVSVRVTVDIFDVNEAPMFSLPPGTATLAAAGASLRLIPGNITITDQDNGDRVVRAEFQISGIPPGSEETLTLLQTYEGYSFESIGSDTYVLENFNQSLSSASLSEVLESVAYTAGSNVTASAMIRTVYIEVFDTAGLGSEPTSVAVSLADTPVFEEQEYTVEIVEGMSQPNFLQVQASVVSGGDKLEYVIESGVPITIDPDDGFLSLTSPLDYDTDPDHQLTFEVYAIDSLPPPRTGTATVVIEIVDINDVHPTIGGIENITVHEDVPVVVFPNITVDDIDTFPLQSATVSVLASEDLSESPFTRRVCEDEKDVITKMEAVCDLEDYTNLLSSVSNGTSTLEEDDFGNLILNNTYRQGYSLVDSGLEDLYGPIEEFTLAFWFRPYPDQSGYVFFFSNNDGTERYIAVYYDASENQLVVTLKREGLSGLAAQIRINFQLEKVITDGDFHFVMLQYENRYLSCAVDGIPIDSSAVLYKEDIFIGTVSGKSSVNFDEVYRA